MGRFSLTGEMIPRTVRRTFDERAEPRVAGDSQTAVLSVAGRRHVVRLLNLSPSGAMLLFHATPRIGEPVTIQLLDRSPATAHICWVRDGKIGVNFAAPLE